ncbi:glycosyltransferase family 2 protein [Oscillatoriales cyanobacterium LEGE 11467]|uniref:Glycosyltransferase family 2 protein n=1 Tax=Zarconia navalis LEGE 11467 TaxID=1828826 RepID=A0A928VTF7_9CYAN|nr:glycosyltransferase family 2 protein [Zarconia navalis]MBE9040039.1 glycosyltransferase family 2 protein [Zarconia navalis LEGE 11467]
MNTENWQVPNHEIVELAPKKSRYCICIPIINEGLKIEKQLDRMREISSRFDVIIADGGSSDGSTQPEKLSQRGVRTLLVKQDVGKLSAQLRMGFAYATRQGYDGAIVIDGNNKDDPSAIPSFAEALDAGCDHVQGSRFVPGGEAINTPRVRFWAIKLIHAPLIRLAAGWPYTDTTNGFRAYSRRLLLDERVAPFREVFSGYELHYYLAIRAARLGYNVRELPVTRTYPQTGPTPTKISPIRGNILVMQTLIQACLGNYDPKSNSIGEVQS